MSERPWPPTASREALRTRAALLAAIRGFFAARDVLEVETPQLSHAAGSEPHLQPIMVTCHPRPGDRGQTLYLQTSPEFAMKRLLAAGSGPIYQLARAFRDGEAGARHNPEFTLLEWYRPGFDDRRLMAEVSTLLAEVADIRHVERLSYRALFQRYLGLDPHTAGDAALARTAAGAGLEGLDGLPRASWLDLLFSHVIEPALTGAVLIYDYPRCQAALARLAVDDYGEAVARRFELVIDGLEVANGYYELTDPEEQAARFAADLERRRREGQPCPPVDEAMLAALHHGLPECAGVALGVDRLLMAMLGTRMLSDVLAFPYDRA